MLNFHDSKVINVENGLINKEIELKPSVSNKRDNIWFNSILDNDLSFYVLMGDLTSSNKSHPFNLKLTKLYYLGTGYFFKVCGSNKDDKASFRTFFISSFKVRVCHFKICLKF
jgi:hypothetical protein